MEFFISGFKIIGTLFLFRVDKVLSCIIFFNTIEVFPQVMFLLISIIRMIFREGNINEIASRLVEVTGPAGPVVPLAYMLLH